MVRGTWLSNNHELYSYGLPCPLLAHIRSALRGDEIPTSPKTIDCNEVRVCLRTLCLLNGLDFDLHLILGEAKNL